MSDDLRGVKQPKHIAKRDEPVWATECVWRRPKFKVHQSLGHARSAVQQRMRYMDKWLSGDWNQHQLREIDVYERVDGVWVWHPELSIGRDSHDIVWVESKWHQKGGSWRMVLKEMYAD